MILRASVLNPRGKARRKTRTYPNTHTHTPLKVMLDPIFLKYKMELSSALLASSWPFFVTLCQRTCFDRACFIHTCTTSSIVISKMDLTSSLLACIILACFVRLCQRTCFDRTCFIHTRTTISIVMSNMDLTSALLASSWPFL